MKFALGVHSESNGHDWGAVFVIGGGGGRFEKVDCGGLHDGGFSSRACAGGVGKSQRERPAFSEKNTHEVHLMLSALHSLLPPGSGGGATTGREGGWW